MANILDANVRREIIGSILGEENRQRKEESLKRFEIFRERQSQFILNRLAREFSAETVRNMRTITSINLVKRIVEEEASIYRVPPERTFSSGYAPIDDASNIKAQIDALYDEGEVNMALKKANIYFKLCDQCAIQVLPKNGKIISRVLLPHHYDVIPNDINPEEADVYIISSFDKTLTLNGQQTESLSNKQPLRDNLNQPIADPEDYKKSLLRFVWWSADYNFITNGNGEILDENMNVVQSPAVDQLINELGELPFIDVADAKDYEFFVRSGNNVVEFALDFGVLLSDLANIIRLQGYAQAIVYAENPPNNVNVGPQQILHIPLDPTKESQPRFEFATPSPDLQHSLEFIESCLRMFLTSRGIDPKVISGKVEAQRFTSGIERLLSMIDKFEATRDDLELFEGIESKLFSLLVKWSNLFQGATIKAGQNVPLIAELNQATLPEDLELKIEFRTPEIVQTKTETETSVINLINEGLMSRVEAIQQLRDVDEPTAQKIVQGIDQEAFYLKVGSLNAQVPQSKL